jgi:hypothetical protein
MGFDLAVKDGIRLKMIVIEKRLILDSIQTDMLLLVSLYKSWGEVPLFIHEI